MDINELKLELIRLIIDTQDESVLKSVMDVFEANKNKEDDLKN